MSPAQFVELLKTECRDAAVNDCIASFVNPPGRKADPALLKISSWFNALEARGREMVAIAMTEAAGATLFGVLAVLDRSRPIEPYGEKSEFHLFAHNRGVVSIICPSSQELHDL